MTDTIGCAFVGTVVRSTHMCSSYCTSPLRWLSLSGRWRARRLSVPDRFHGSGPAERDLETPSVPEQGALATTVEGCP
jgi:hypothetical protein